MIVLAEHAEGWVLPVRALPGARRSGVRGERAGSLLVAVAAPPEDGRANRALIEELSAALGVKRSQVERIGGQTSRDKRFLIRGLTRAELEGRLAELFRA
jgi:uncharacterized protein (TIGR00251 family)